MGKAIYDRYPAAKRVFEAADAALGFSLSKLCFEGPEAELQLTANAQPAILTTSIALLRVLEEQTGLTPSVVAGHSLGEYSALVCAGAVSLADAVRIVRRRGELMQQAVPAGTGSMAAIGATAAETESLCREAAQGEVLSVANYNGTKQCVIAGSAQSVARALAVATQKSIASKALKVSAPFHCALMQPAADGLRDALQKTVFAGAGLPVISNVDAKPYQAASDVADRLVRQVTAPVRWVESVQALASSGVTHVVELGAGKVLSGLIRKIDGKLTVLTCEGPADVDAIAANPALQAFRSKPGAPAEKKSVMKDWSLMTPSEREQALGELIEFDRVITMLDAKPHDIYRWLSVNKLPTWLVDGALKFHPVQLDAWLAEIGGIAALKKKEADAAASDAAKTKST